MRNLDRNERTFKTAVDPKSSKLITVKYRLYNRLRPVRQRIFHSLLGIYNGVCVCMAVFGVRRMHCLMSSRKCSPNFSHQRS